MKTILVTGANGYVGKHLIPQLRKNNCSVRCLVRKKNDSYSYLRDHGCDVVYGDLRDKLSLYSISADIDIVIHLAAVTKSGDPSVREVNVTGTENLVDACKKNKIKRIVFLSSTAAAKVLDSYGKSKKLAEEVISKSNIPYTILRPSIIYSEDSPMIKGIVKINKKIPFFTPIVGNGRYTINPVYINDVIFAIINVLNHKDTIGKTYTIVGPKNITFDNFIEIIHSNLGIKRKKIHIPFFLCYATVWIL